jgi:hypothetical protein
LGESRQRSPKHSICDAGIVLFAGLNQGWAQSKAKQSKSTYQFALFDVVDTRFALTVTRFALTQSFAGSH